jgi:ribonuclease-3
MTASHDSVLPTGDQPGEAISPEGPGLLDRLEETIGVRFSDRSLLVRALTHHSATAPGARQESYDTLEFLGDALIAAGVVEHIFRTYRDAAEGEMTALKSEVVSRRVLAQIGCRLGLDGYIRVNVAALRTFNERSRLSLCADALEALVAAIHLDQGRDAARAFIIREILPVIPEARATLGENDPKGKLQQHALRRYGALPRYDMLAEGGTSNDRVYTVGVHVGDRLLATATGTSLKEAGREAARAALRTEMAAPDADFAR